MLWATGEGVEGVGTLLGHVRAFLGNSWTAIHIVGTSRPRPWVQRVFRSHNGEGVWVGVVNVSSQPSALVSGLREAACLLEPTDS